MSKSSLKAFVKKLHDEFENNTAKEKRLEYNLLTHSFSYSQTVFIAEMVKELSSRKIILNKKRLQAINRLGALFSRDLYKAVSALDAKADAMSGITRFTGSETSFNFVFTTDIRTGKTPNNWAKGQADVFDKIKVTYSDAYRKFFFGIRDEFKKSSKARKQFNKHYKLNEQEDLQSKGKMGQSGHAEGAGVVETMTREFFDKHADSVFNYKSKNVSTEKELLADLKKMGVDLDFMRSTSDMTQEISLIGAADNILKGHEIKAQLKKARKQLKKLIDNPKMIDRMMNLEGSDSFNTIKEKKLLREVTDPFTKIKNAKVQVSTKDLTVKHSRSKNKSKAKETKSRKQRTRRQVIALKGVHSLSSAGKVKQTQGPSYASKALLMMVAINKQLPERVASNMGDPALNYQTGRLASSVRITDIVKTPKGFNSAGYTYDKSPYQTFEVGYKQGSVQRDPRKLIDRSIREIAAEQAMGRFFTRRV